MKQSHSAIRFWLPACILAVVTLWLGCEQKGDVTPTSASRQVLTFIDTVTVDPQLVGPGGIASLGARILTETNEPAAGENVRFSVSRGALGSGRADTTVLSDVQGWARTSFTAPTDTGPIVVRSELLSMSEMRVSTVRVSASQAGEGMMVVWTDRDTLFADNGVSRSHIYARLRNEAHNPIGGATVYFSTTAGSITSPAVTDSVSGTATATLVSTTEVGEAVILASYGTVTDTARVRFIEPSTASLIVLSSADLQLTAGIDSTVVTARVYDDQNLPVVDNTVVFFSTDGGILGSLTTRTKNGAASTTLYAPANTGSIRVTATTGGSVTAFTDLTINPGVPAEITLSTSEDTLYADHSSEAAVRALVVDAFDNPVVEGTPVSFSAQGGTITQSAMIGEDGYAVATFRAGLTVGPAAIQALQGTLRSSISIYLEPTAASSVQLNANPLLLTADGTSQSDLQVLVLDEDNAPVSDGTPVMFSAQTGNITGASSTLKFGGGAAKRTSQWTATVDRLPVKSASKSGNSFTVRRGQMPGTMSTFSATTENGYARAVLTSPTTAGADTVRVTVQSLSAQQTLSYRAGAPAHIIVTPDLDELPADGMSSTAVTCRVTDAFGNAVPSGIAVSATSTMGGVHPSSGYTNNDGVWVTSISSSRQRGLCGIVVNADEASGYGEISFTMPEVHAVVLAASTPSLLADGISTTALTAAVLDNYGLPIQGATVSWQMAAGPADLLPMSTMTDSSGFAYATVISGASQTDYTQAAQATAGSHSDARTLQFRGVQLTVWTDESALPADGASTTMTRVLVRESTSGFAVTNATVQLAATLGSIAQTATTDNSGIAQALYRSSTTSGEVQVTAYYGDTLRAQTAMHLTSTAADTLIVVMGQNELLADGVASTTVRALVLDEAGRPVPNTSVTFGVTGPGSILNPVVVSNDSGYATAVYQTVALTEDQQAAVEAAIERDQDSKPLLLRGLTLNVSSEDASLPANGQTTTQVRIELRQSSSLVAVSNAAIQLGSSLGVIPNTATTNASGVATVTYTAGSETGVADIIARYGALLTDTVHLNLFAPSASTMQVSASSASLLGDGTDYLPVSVTITDQRGMPLPNVLVNWTKNGPGTISGLTSTTNASGYASVNFTSPSTATDVQTQVTATVGVLSQGVTLHSRGITVALEADQMMLPANGNSSTQVRAHVRETSSMVAVQNRTVNFGTSLGSISGSTETDTAGIARVMLTASQTAGIADVVCRYGNLLTDTVEVTFYSPAPAEIIAFADTSLLRADGVSRTPVRAYVYDAMGVPLGGVSVAWNAGSGSVENAWTVTNAAGVSTVLYQTTASSTDRIVNITATAGAAEGIAQVFERGVTMQVTANPSSVIADGNSSTQIRAHVFETTTAVGISNAIVNMGTSLGTIASNAMTDASGTATATLISTTQTGVAVVQTHYGALPVVLTEVTFAPSTPTALTLTASPTVLLADNSSISALTAVVTDQNGNPVPNGTQVRFSIPAQSGSLENVRPTNGGVASNTLTSSATPDTVQIVAWSDANPSARDSATVIYIVGMPAVVTMSAQRDTLAANGIAVDTITAHVTDVVGHLLSNVEVRFTSTVGNITASRVTDAQGNARVAFSSSQTGTAQITATAGAASGLYTIHLVSGLPNSITMEYFPASVGVRGSGRNETLLITATVRDANNNPVVDGTTVYFNINNSPGGGDFLSSGGPIPTINGRASVSYNSGMVAGSARIRARCNAISAVSTEILVHAGPPYIENITDGCATSHMSLAPSPCSMFGMDVVGDSVVLVALVGDRYNNPVTPGTAVYFTTSAGVITTATGYTDSLGFARVTLYSGNPLPSISRWLNTLRDPNTGGAILCTDVPPQPGVAKVLATSAGVDANGDSVTVWAATNVWFDYSQPNLFIREVTANGDPDLRTLYIGESALIRIAVYDYDFWPMPYGSVIRFSANHGMVYPQQITIGCPGDTTYYATFFNNLSLTDEDAASPVLVTVDTRQGDSYAFTESFTLRASLPTP